MDQKQNKRVRSTAVEPNCNKPDPDKRQKRHSPVKSSLKFHDIWKLVASSQYLTTSELGRLLLFTSKCTANGEDEQTLVWKLLCQSQWGTVTANALLEATQMNPKDYFITFTAPPKREEPYVVPPLKYSPQDYILIVEVRKRESNELLFCQAIPGEKMPDFFSNGEACFKLDSPIPNHFKLDRSYSSFEEFQEATVARLQEEFQDIDDPLEGTDHDPCYLVGGSPSWKVSVHLMRKPDRKVVQLLAGEKHIRGFIDGPDMSESLSELILKDHYDITYGNSFSVSGRPPMTQALRALTDDLDIPNSAISVGGMILQLALHYSVCLGSPGIDTASLSLCGFNLSTMLVSENDVSEYAGSQISEVLEGKGMQFAHLLETLPEWDQL